MAHSLFRFCSFVLAVGAVLTLFVSSPPALAANSPSRPKLVMLISEPEYLTATSLPPFAKEFLEKQFRVVTVSGSTKPDINTFDRMEEIADADVLLVSVRRRTPDTAHLDLVRRHIAAGKAVVGIRTASHAFALGKNQKLGPGDADWADWDPTVLGGHYTGHHGTGPITTVALVNTTPVHPILKGMPPSFTTASTLYKASPLDPKAQTLLVGTIPNQSPEPIAWTLQRADGGRTFYTSLGGPNDFENPAFTRLLRNGIFWAAGLEANIPATEGSAKAKKK